VSAVAVLTAVAMPLGAILTTYQESDNCIPLSALFRALMDAGVRLSEMGFRSPSIVSGLLLLALLPLGAARRLPRGATPAVAAFAWLLALSPLLVFYSRIARSYLPMTFCALAAAAAFAAWWRTLRPAFGAAYAVLGGLAVWLHLGAAPIVAAPFLFAAFDLAWGKREERRRRLLHLALLAGGLALAFAAFLLPARESLSQLVAEKRQAQSLPWETVADVLRLQAGTASPAWTVFFWVDVLGGMAALLAFDRRLGLYTFTLAGVQVLGIRLLSPLGLANPLILSRYLLPVLPLLLLWAACALALPWRLLARLRGVGVPPPGRGRVGSGGGQVGAVPSGRDASVDIAATPLLTSPLSQPPPAQGGGTPTLGLRLMHGALAAAFILTLAAHGPFADRTLWASSFMHHNDFLAFYAPRPRLAPEAVPYPYLEIAKLGGKRAVVEYPWSSFAGLRTPYLYQEVHGRRVQVSGPQRLLFAPTLAFANAVPPGPEGFCGSGARFLVVHLHVGREEDRIVAPEGPRLGERPMRPDLRRTLRLQAEAMAQSLTALWGDPTWSAPSLRAWDLDAACKRQAGGS